MHTIIARWQDWSGRSIEHLVLKEGPNQIVANAAILGSIDGHVFAARYKILCDADWRVRKVEISEIGSDLTLELASDGVGNWADGSGAPQPQLGRAIDVDISITPFTNTLPIRRLNLQRGQSQEILAVYIQLPNIAITTDRQRYTCIEPAQRYRYESVDSDFSREIEIDAHGLVTSYPSLFRRLVCVGSEFNVVAFAHPKFNRQSLEAHIRLRSSLAFLLGQVMPFWMGSSTQLNVLHLIKSAWRFAAIAATIQISAVSYFLSSVPCPSITGL